MRKFYASLAVLTLIVSGALLFTVMVDNSSAALPRDCDNNSIIDCGSVTSSELAQRYNENKTGDLPAVYQQYGLGAYEMTHADTAAKLGEVHQDGRVTVGGETVATDTTSIGRQNIFSGSTQKVIAGKTYFDTPSSRAFARESIVAFVFFDQNGQFKSAILTSCGNPVSGKPTPKPPTPTPPKLKSAKFTCDSLKVTKIDNSNTKFQFDTAYTVENATFKNVTYVIRDGSNKEIARTVEATYTQDQPGAYTVQAIVTANVNGNDETATSAACQKPFEIATAPKECKPGIPVDDERCKEKPPVECKPGVPMGDAKCSPCLIPGKEQFTKDSPECQTQLELPHTGPMDVIGGGIGAGSLVAVGYYWYTSRRGLLDALLGQQ